MKKLIVTTCALALCLLNTQATEPFEKGEFAVEYFSAYSTAQSSILDTSLRSLTKDGAWSEGIGLSYYPHLNVGVLAETASADWCDEPFQTVGLSLVLRAPMQTFGVAPYALAGGSTIVRECDSVFWHAGAGIEWRPLSGGESALSGLRVFADARYIWPHRSRDSEGAMFRLGTGWAF